LREALGTNILPNKKLTLVVSGKGGAAGTAAGHGTEPAAVAAAPAPARMYVSPRPLSAMRETAEGEVHWSYDGENGPQAWGRLKPEFVQCAVGKRQSPINIEEGATLLGPAEPIEFNYSPSQGSVVNNGHTIQVDVQGENSIVVRGSTFRLVQFHFHTPSEEQIDFRRYPMVAHLVHKNDEGQLAVVAVLLEPAPGNGNPVIEKVWTYMPLDTNDRVRLPRESLNLNEILPDDRRYFQFMGSLTTPPCTEGVLWLVLKKPVQLSKAQLRIFTQVYPHNARPTQPLNGRPVREEQ
jgi:carbonic anhydrase